MSEPSPEQSFTIHLKSLTDFADEFTTQIQSLQAPMDHLATMSDTAPQYGAFHEAWTLGAGEQAAIEEMYSLLGQVKQAIAFAGDVTGTVADGYQNADESVAYALGGPPTNTYTHGPVSDPWSGDGNGNGQQHGGPNQQTYTDPTQTTPVIQVTATPVTHATDPGPLVPNQNTSGPFPGTPMTADVPLAGALLGGALLGGAARSKSGQQPKNTTKKSTVTVSFDEGTGTSTADSTLWTPPPDPNAASPWTAAFPDSPQGGS
jgi:hypothetical protein